jgi:hypothetical protein
MDDLLDSPQLLMVRKLTKKVQPAKKPVADEKDVRKFDGRNSRKETSRQESSRKDNNMLHM